MVIALVGVVVERDIAGTAEVDGALGDVAEDVAADASAIAIDVVEAEGDPGGAVEQVVGNCEVRLRAGRVESDRRRLLARAARLDSFSGAVVLNQADVDEFVLRDRDVLEIARANAAVHAHADGVVDAVEVDRGVVAGGLDPDGRKVVRIRMGQAAVVNVLEAEMLERDARSAE